jgi:glycosyltransferase involved in cell wall biosynthesis
MHTDLSKLKVAIVHDWLISARGGERVLDALCEIFPQAEIFTLIYREGRNTPRIENRKIHTSFLNQVPGVEKYYRYLLPLMPLAAERLPLQGFDLILSSSHCVAKGIIPDPSSLHVSYCYTTMRYAWDQSSHYFGTGLKSALISPFLHYLRMWDVTSAHRVDHFIAISNFIGRRIRKYYGRSSDVIFPFVDLERFQPARGEKGDYYLMVTAFAPYKRVELAIEACETLGKRLIIVGGGQDGAALRKLARGKTEFLGNLPDSQLPDLYAGARALLFPGIEDFGITPLEAMACGTPVIAYGAGGALETIEDGKTGLFFQEPTASSLAGAIMAFEARTDTDWSTACRERASFFSRARFQNEMLGTLGKLLDRRLPLSAENRNALPDFYLG